MTISSRTPTRLGEELYDVDVRFLPVISFAYEGHKGQLYGERRHGSLPNDPPEPFLCHLVRVANMLNTQDATTYHAAILHDYLEDVLGAIPDDIIHRFGVRVYTWVDRLTRRPEQDYLTGYIPSILQTMEPAILRIKLADIQDHLDGMKRYPAYETMRFRNLAAQTMIWEEQRRRGLPVGYRE